MTYFALMFLGPAVMAAISISGIATQLERIANALHGKIEEDDDEESED